MGKGRALRFSKVNSLTVPFLGTRCLICELVASCLPLVHAEEENRASAALKPVEVLLLN